ncbi:hypothetical protein CFE70_009525 [Pyrenophora teres f. teres 0-1]
MTSVSVETQIKKLRLQGKTIKATWDLSEKETAKTFVIYAKKECLDLCAKVRKTFPREIRDIIYGYITYPSVYNARPGAKHGKSQQSRKVSEKHTFAPNQKHSYGKAAG